MVELHGANAAKLQLRKCMLRIRATCKIGWCEHGCFGEASLT
jgi:hypothetical protein